jgi:hypothetical protein
MRLLTAFLLMVSCGAAHAQDLQPGFSKTEYIELLKISAQSTSDTGYARKNPPPEKFTLHYRSPVLGLDNRYDLWTDGQGTLAISIRGTTRNQVSWLENFYAAMTPAQGEISMPNGQKFGYNLTNYPNAAVHAGWLLGMAFLGQDMLPRLDSAYSSGVRNLLVMGHSQGGAIAYLLTAFLRQRQADGQLPAGWRIKTYCSAAPKPGNLPFAYAYEAATAGGWAFNVVNSVDWVPETPVTIQTLEDFNSLNPFSGAKASFGKQKFPMRVALKHVYNRLNNSTRKARKTYVKYLGKVTGSRVRKVLEGMELPAGYNTSHYVRTGQFVVLLADNAYLKQHPNTSKNAFEHHLHAPYLQLAQQLPDNQAAPVSIIR